MTLEEFLKFIAESGRILFSGAIGGALGYLLKTQIDHRLAISRNFDVIRTNEFNKASAAFRVEFANTIRLLRHNELKGNTNIAEIITNETIATQERAKILFDPFIPSVDLNSFNEAWEEYVNRYDSEYPKTSITNHTEYTKEFSHIYLGHIDNLLKFAEPKLS